ncbi:MAG: CRISPR-associated endonuclease Cas1 [Candidatus Magnetoovum sp. WYHC-5]|nr:CRISPR-associated endonuclease Cas1 [Candidatus Magnetoovum sp. WYHC-5]
MGLFEDICSFRNLCDAFDKVEENAGAPGIDNITIEEFSVSLNSRLTSLRNSLLDKTYRSLPLRKIGIKKSDGTLRKLLIPTVRDRVVQTAACFVLTPLLDKEFMEQGSVLRKEDERIVITKGEQVIKEIPAIKIDQILLFGSIQVTTQAMKYCLEQDIPIIILSSTGKYYGAVESFNYVNPVLHAKQFELSGSEGFSLTVGKAIVRAKLLNSKILMQKYDRNRNEPILGTTINTINSVLNKLSSVETIAELMGMEGAGSAAYFSVLRALVGSEWGFNARKKQPPTDPVNSMLSYGYTLLFYNFYALVRSHGLHPYAGFLHGIRHGHPALVSDLVEEFRAPVVDAVVLNIISRNALSLDDFDISDSDGFPCLLKSNARKVFIKAFESKMNSLILHKTSGIRTDYRRCMDLQVQMLKRLIEGTLQEYKPFTIK